MKMKKYNDFGVYNGNCLEIMDQLIEKGVKVDCVITDPPYKTITGGTPSKNPNNINKPIVSGILDENNNFGWKPPQGWKQFKRDWISKCYELMKESTHIYIMVNLLELEDMMNAVRKSGFHIHNLLVWDKKRSNPNRFYMKQIEYVIFAKKGYQRYLNNMSTSNLISMSFKKDEYDSKHPTPKPIKLMEHFIRNSTNKGELVLDPFAGVGSTLVAAKNLGRKSIGIEMVEYYCNIAIERITGG